MAPDALGVFRLITLPLLRRILLIALLFRTLDALRAFDVMFVLTGGGPANTTETLTVYAYRSLFQTLQLGLGSAIGVIVFALVMLVAWGYLRPARRGDVVVTPPDRQIGISRERTVGSAEAAARGAVPAAFATCCVLLLLAGYAIPFFWQLLTSFKPDAVLVTLPPLLPSRITLAHYDAVIGQSLIPRALGNSLAVALVTTVVALALGRAAPRTRSRACPCPGRASSCSASSRAAPFLRSPP